MTFGEKLRDARKNAGLSQEQIAERLSVSRSAIAKWETDKGMPDITNLKAMSQLLGVSIDYLLDEDNKLSFSETKEPIDLSSFEKTGNCRSREDAACFAKFKDADAIIPLIRRKKLSKKEALLDLIVAPGVLDVADSLNNNSSYYLVESGNKQFLVNITKDFIITSELAVRVDSKRFEIGTNKFKGCTYRLI